MAIIHLLLFIAPQVLIYLYLRERLPDPTRPRRARMVRWGLAVVFGVMNLPWIIVARRMLFGSLWGIGRIPWIAPWVAWQMMGWVFCALVALYVAGKGVRSVWYASTGCGSPTSRTSMPGSTWSGTRWRRSSPRRTPCGPT